jgi:radical SAM superfamily enzyme YgiQ (UPF0313 family)
MKFCVIVPESPYLFNPWTIEPLGALYLAGAAKEIGADVSVRVWSQEPLPEADWYGISVLTPNYEQVRGIISHLRGDFPWAKIVLGGAHCTFLPRPTLTDLRPDYLVAGEGENVLQHILNGLEGDPPGVYRLLDGSDIIIGDGLAVPPDFPSLPIPDHSLLLHDYFPNRAWTEEPGGAITASRGCPYNCSYCGKSVGHRARWRTPGSVAQEMKFYDQWRFEDDDIFGNLSWFGRFAELIPTGKEWRCSVRGASVNERILELAKKAGCQQVGVGVETASSKLLKVHCPSKSVKVNTRAVRMIKDADLQVTAFLIAGLPGETDETVQETIDWIHEVKPDKFTVSACTPYPGSPLWRYPEKYGMFNIDTEFENYRQLGREDERTAFVFDTKNADRRELTRLWHKLREVAQYGIAKDQR